MNEEELVPGYNYVLTRKVGKFKKGTVVNFRWWCTGWEKCHCNAVGFPSFDDAIEVKPEHLEKQ